KDFAAVDPFIRDEWVPPFDGIFSGLVPGGQLHQRKVGEGFALHMLFLCVMESDGHTSSLPEKPSSSRSNSSMYSAGDRGRSANSLSEISYNLAMVRSIRLWISGSFA